MNVVTLCRLSNLVPLVARWRQYVRLIIPPGRWFVFCAQSVSCCIGDAIISTCGLLIQVTWCLDSSRNDDVAFVGRHRDGHS
jgi:hypothetical protein